MKALTFQGKHRIVHESIPDPEIVQPDDVIISVKLCAICGSDLHVYHEHEKGLEHGTAMGHEFMGEVVATGKGVKNFRTGALVMCPFSTSCGKCFFCVAGLSSRCVYSQLFGWIENGRGLHGGQAEFVRVPMADETLLPIPDGVSDEEALMLGDIIPTGFFCAHQAGIRHDGTYVVVGCGPVGLMAIIGARELGAEKIYAVDVVEERLSKAAAFGAIPLNGKEPDAVQDLLDATQGRGADAVMEAVGKPETLQLGLRLLRPGGTLSTVGVCTDPFFAFSPTEAYNKNLTLKVGRCPARSLMGKLIPVVQHKKYDFTSVVSHRMPLHDGPKAYNMFANRIDQCTKVVLSQ